MTNKEMEQAVIHVNNILQQNCELPGEVTYHAIRNRNRMITELKEYLEIKESLIQKYGKINNSGVYEISSEDTDSFKNFVQEIKVIEDIDIEVNIVKMPIEKLSGNYPTSVIAALDFMLE